MLLGNLYSQAGLTITKILLSEIQRPSKDHRISGSKKGGGHRAEREFSEERLSVDRISNDKCLFVRRIFQFTSDVLQTMGELNHVLLLVFLKNL